jgi:hypothetical protein
MQPQALAAHMNASAWIGARIQQFSASIPRLSDYHDRGDDARTLAITHAMVGAALIQLHKNDANASATCLNAARAITVALGDADVPNFLCAGPVVGTLLLLACQVAMREIERTRYFRASLGSTLNVEVVSNQEEAGLLLDLQNGLTTMAIYAVDSPLVRESHIPLRRRMCVEFDDRIPTVEDSAEMRRTWALILCIAATICFPPAVSVDVLSNTSFIYLFPFKLN